MIRMKNRLAILIYIINRSAVQNGDEYLNLRRFRLNERRKHELANEALVARCMGMTFCRVAGRVMAAFMVVYSLDNEEWHECYE